MCVLNANGKQRGAPLVSVRTGGESSAEVNGGGELRVSAIRRPRRIWHSKKAESSVANREALLEQQGRLYDMVVVAFLYLFMCVFTEWCSLAGSSGEGCLSLSLSLAISTTNRSR